MRVEERLETVVKKVYVAFDGTEFDNEKGCKVYELKEKHRQAGNLIYVVRHRFKANAVVELFSTKELAEKSLLNVDDESHWIIEEVVIDWRFIR